MEGLVNYQPFLKFTNMFGTFSINSDSDKYSLDANYDFEENKFYMPSLIFNYIKESSGYSVAWNNTTYLYENFLPFLKRFLVGEVIFKDKLEYAPVINELTEDDADELIEILEKGRELGWDKL